MAYQTGTASNPNDLLQKLVTFLVANGWTQDMSQADGTGWRAHLHRSGVYVNLKATTGAVNPWAFTPNPNASSSDAALHIYLGDGFSGASNWNLQPGGPLLNGTTNRTGCSMPLPQGSITAYHFFSDETGDNIMVVVERTPGNFTHMEWGVSVNKAGSYTGGPYFGSVLNGYNAFTTSTSARGGRLGPTAGFPFNWGDGSGTAAGSYVRADVDSFTGKWLGLGDSTSQPSGGYTGKNAAAGIRQGSSVTQNDIPLETWFWERLTSVFTGQPTLLPCRIYVPRDAGGFSLLGEVPGIFKINAVPDLGFAAGSIISLGADSYMLFPNFAVRKVG